MKVAHLPVLSRSEIHSFLKNIITTDPITDIRRAAKESIDALQVTGYTPAVRASNVISILDEILQDPNMPPYTRVKLWNVMSILEAIKD